MAVIGIIVTVYINLMKQQKSCPYAEAHNLVQTLENGMISSNTVIVRMVPYRIEFPVVYIFFRTIFHFNKCLNFKKVVVIR